ncbi:MAG: type II secretion system F family protein [Lachnospiraceae bacterium]|nr:type II secretion system F family protein [Lachnospiraceae bacterium]
MRYDKYKLSFKECFIGIFIWSIASLVLSYFFYRSFMAGVIIFLFFPVFLIFVKKYLLEQRKWKMTLEFKEMIRIIAVNLQAGSSAENAFRNAYREIKYMFGEKSFMTKECEFIVRGLENNLVLENLVASFGERSCIEEIKDFSEVFSIAKRSGGNLKEIISDTTDVIDTKIEMKREFRTLISSKRFEHRLMCVIPFVILGYIGVTSPGYFDMLYGNMRGVMIMTVCLFVYLGAFLWGEKIADIKA